MAIFRKMFAVRDAVAKIAIAILVSTPVWADDTEIFFADTVGEDIRTNVLFIIDTSGSMSEIVLDDNGNSTGKSRLQQVQDGFKTLLNQLTNVNVGLMRFSNGGGPILYPVVNIDADVSSVTDVEVISRVAGDNDDAHEVLASGEMVLDDDRLSLTKIAEGGVVSGPYYINASDLDSEELNDGRAFYNSPDLDFTGAGRSAFRITIGTKFTGLDIPRGAMVTLAEIQFTVDDVEDGEPIPYEVYAELDDSGDFRTSNNDISNRIQDVNPPVRTSMVPWTIPGGMNRGDEVRVDVSSLVQQVIADPSWDAPNGEEDDMVFVFRPVPADNSDGYVEFFSYDGTSDPRNRPTLYLEYYVGGTAPMEQETETGLRFRNLDIPKGVKITSAYLEFTSDRDQSGDFTFSVSAEKSATADAYTSTDENITNRPSFTDVPVIWSDDQAVGVGETFTSPNLKDIVENVVGLPGWCGGNDLALQVKGTEGFRSAWSHDGDPSLAPRLIVRYDESTIVPGNSCYRDEVGPRISKSINDVEENTGNGNLLRNGSVLDLDGNNLIGLRFEDVQIPKDATIYNAYLEITQRNDRDSGDTAITIALDTTRKNAGVYKNDNKVTDRTYGPSIVWDIDQTWRTGRTYPSDPITTLVQEAVSGGWSAGNAMAFKLTTSGANRRAYSYDSSPAQAPRLVVEFSADGSDRSTRKVREELLSVVNNLSHNGWTPVQDTLYEAMLYYTGGNADWGKTRGGYDGGPFSYTRVSNPASMVPGTFLINNPPGCTDENQGASACRGQYISGNATYSSPIDNYCQKTSHIILLTDGFANRDHSQNRIVGKGISCDDPGTGDGGRCVKDLVRYMKDTDLITGGGIDASDGNGLKLKQRVITHTIGFQFASQWLKEVGEVDGGGFFYRADNADQLVTAINSILIDALKVDNTFVAPVAAVNQFNRLNNLNDIYFAVFRPDEYPRWPGNLKKYKLGTGNEVLGLGDSGDADTSAVDVGTGFFKQDSTDLWNDSGTADGSDVEKGGASSQIPGYATRNVYTYLESSSTNVLSAAENQLNAAQVTAGVLTKSLFGANTLSNDEFDDLIQWIRGKDVPNSADRKSFNDPLHSRPVAITYDAPDPDDPDNQDVEIFLGSNGGGLHAYDAATGVETFAFFPEATLPLQNELKQNRATTPHLYGIDGSIVPWIRDLAADGIDTSDGDSVRLFFGMRRGGSNYYSLDVTDRANPKVQWILEGGSDEGYAEMGQSWGTPLRGKIRLKDESPRDVLFISGGYDTAKDNEVTRSADSSGRAIFIVDAETGALVWSGGPTADFDETFTDMLYSIPSGLTVADVDSDGLDDLIFVGDTGGQVWRFDINKGVELEDLVSGGVIADLGVASGDNTEVRNRRFFHAPDVALTKRDGQLELALTIGSGYRPSPLSNVTEDRFYMLRQLAVFGPPTEYIKLTTANLFDATDNRVGDGVDGAGNAVSKVDARSDLEAKKGWYIDLKSLTSPGEKVLSTPLALDDTVTFVTYTPNANVVDCRAVAGTSKVYSVLLEDAQPAIDFNELDGSLNEGDRAFTLKTPSIIDEPVVICTGEGCNVFTGAEQPPLGELLNDRITRTYWRKDE